MKPYKHFKAYVLRTAEKELKELADEGRSDCWFEFAELPEGFDGEPQRFDFTVHLCEQKTAAVPSIAVSPQSTAPSESPELKLW
jgi:hypothetical protein